MNDEDAISNPDIPAINRAYAASHVQRRNMAGFRAPKLDTVRVGIIGLHRSANHLKALVQLEGVEIRAICDKRPSEVKKSMVWFKDTDHHLEIYNGGEDEWKKLCERTDLDLIFICSPIPLHAQMSIYAAALSAIVPLTSWSAQNRSNSIDIPDFTCGAWRDNPRNMDINFENGGGNTRILPPSQAAMTFDDHLAKQWEQNHAQ